MLVTPVFAEDAENGAAAENTASELTSEQELLASLGFINPDSYGLIDNTQEITRIDFASTVGKIINIDPTVAASFSYYDDVAADSWAAHTLNTLTDMGIITVPSDRMFRPNDKILCTEAVKMLVSLMGYDNYAKNLGGYPNGYTVTAGRLKLLSGVSASQALTNGAASKLLYNAVHTKILDIESVGKNIGYTNTTDKTLLSQYHSIYVNEGIAESAEGITISGKKVSAGKCIIGDEVYYNGSTAIEKYIGYYLKFYYSDIGGEKTLVHIDAGKNNTVTIASDDYIGYSGGEISYYTDSDRKTKEEISSSATVVKNGSVVTNELAEAYENIDNGKILIVDNDRDGKFDAVFIENYQTVVVESINLTEGKILDALRERNVIDVSDDAAKNIFIYDAIGNKSDLSAVQRGSVIDVAIGEDSVMVHMNNNIVSGEVNSVNTEDKTVEIDGVLYDYYQASYEKYHFTNGKKGSFRTNMFGKIAYFEEGEVTRKPGYLIKAASKSGISSRMQLKILTKDSGIKIFTTAARVKIDGEKYSGSIEKALENAAENVILYDTDANDEITYIDTITVGAKENDDSLRLLGRTTGSEADRLLKMGSKLSRDYILSDDVLVFVTPEKPEEADDDKYLVMDYGRIIDNKAYAANVYKTGSGSKANIISLIGSEYTFNYDDNQHYMVVKKVVSGKDKDGEPVTKVTCLEKNAEKTFNIKDGYDIIPKKGDVIKVGLNSENETELIEIYFDYETRKGGAIDFDSPYFANFGTNNPQAPHDVLEDFKASTDYANVRRILYGHAVDIEGDVLTFGDDVKGSENKAEAFVIPSNAAVIVYDEDTDEFRYGSVGDIKPSAAYGADCSEVVVSTRYGQVVILYVMNNRK